MATLHLGDREVTVGQNVTRFALAAAGMPTHVMGRLGASLVAAMLLLTMPGLGPQAALGSAANTPATVVGNHNQDVTKGATNTTVVSDTNPSVYGQPVTFTATVSATAPGHTVTNYTDLSISGPEFIAAGSDGALWFTNWGNASIGRISIAGTVTNYTDTSISGVLGIAAGPDGALWFVSRFNGIIGRISTSGVVTNYTDPSISGPLEIATGPDGALWFTNVGGSSSIGRIGTNGAVTNYANSSIRTPFGIVAGPDGALWFTNNGNNSIGRITTSGTVTNYTGSGISAPQGIAVGPDGALWFINTGNNSIGRITTSGTVTNYSDSSIYVPYQIAAGPDGALWFTNFGNNSIGRIDASTHAITSYWDQTIHDPDGITAGQDGALWFTNYGNGSIGRISAAGIPTGTVQFKDGGAEIVGCGAVSLVAGSANCGPISDLSTATHTITAIYSGDTDFTTSTSDVLSQVVDQAATTTALGSDHNPANVGQLITFTATVNVSAPGAGSPGGTVNFKDGSSSVGGCSAKTVSGGQATCQTSALTAGTHSITAVYSGSANFNGSTSSPALSQVVNQTNVTTTTSLARTSGNSPSVFGQSLTFTATVTSGSGTPTGSVQLKDGATNLGSPVALDGTGHAGLTITTLSVATHSITAVYLGGGSFTGSTSGSVSQVVKKASTTTAVTSNKNPVKKNTPITFTATVAIKLPGAGTPTGKVIFKINGKKVGSAVVGAGGTATFTISKPKGTYKVTAVYRGDAHFVKSTSPIYSQKVTK